MQFEVSIAVIKIPVWGSKMWCGEVEWWAQESCNCWVQSSDEPATFPYTACSSCCSMQPRWNSTADLEQVQHLWGFYFLWKRLPEDIKISLQKPNKKIVTLCSKGPHVRQEMWGRGLWEVTKFHESRSLWVKGKMEHRDTFGFCCRYHF